MRLVAAFLNGVALALTSISLVMWICGGADLEHLASVYAVAALLLLQVATFLRWWSTL